MRPFSLTASPSSATAPLRVACVQVSPDGNRQRNHAAARAGFERAVQLGADIVLLPEKWSLLGEPDVLEHGAEGIDGTDMALVRDACVQHGIWCVAGSIALREPASEKLRNASFVVAPDGSIAARYDKIHMFDVEVEGVTYRESDVEDGGSEIVSLPVSLPEKPGWHLGLSICYDLRFPELYRALALRGANLVTVPAAFTERTGRDHWEVLLRARAIENSCFVVAANAIGDHGGGKRSYGRSMIIDPWGVVLAQAGDDEVVITADLDMRVLEAVRQSIPSLAGRVPAAYG